MRDLLDRLQRRLPIWSAGMGGGLAGAELVAAVSNGGGLGVLGTGGLRGAAVSALLERTAELTSAPFGANIILPMSNGSDIEACFNARVPVLVLFWGDPQPFVGDAHRRDMYIVAQCGSASDAVAAADAGVDAVILQGIEAGGHVMAVRPLRDTLAETLPALGPVPVIAAGGIATGADIADALKLGARAVSMGSRFAASEESRAHVRYKERLVSAHEDDTVLTELFDRGWQQACHRVIRNEQVETWERAGRPPPGLRAGENDEIGCIVRGHERNPVRRFTVTPPLTDFDGDIEAMPLYAGLSVARISDIKPVSVLLERLHSELRTAVK